MHSGTFPSHLRIAVEQAGIYKHVTSHTFRYSFVTLHLQDLTDIRIRAEEARSSGSKPSAFESCWLVQQIVRLHASWRSRKTIQFLFMRTWTIAGSLKDRPGKPVGFEEEKRKTADGIWNIPATE